MKCLGVIIIINLSMNRSQSQPQLPVKKVKPDFIYRSDEENIIFDTRDLFMQIEFKSTIR